MLRRFQSDMQRIAQNILSGAKVSNVFAHVTPGGGKSALPMIVARELAEQTGYKICWVVPRDSLRSQGEHDFIDPEKMARFGHTSKMRASGNDIRPARDNIGYITTYQAIVANPQLHVDEFMTRNYILFLDECHHVPHEGKSDDAEEAKYYARTKPLVELSKLNVFQTGTPYRHDGNRIAFLPYKRNTNAEIIDTSPRDGWEFIRYSRKDALEEGAIVPLHFYVMDGHATWLDPSTGKNRNIPSMAEASLRDQPAILKTILETDYAHHLLDKCVTEWEAYRDTLYSPAKILVVAPGITVAREYCQYLKRQKLNVLIATSADSVEAKDNINRFKKSKTDILVTVGMAYEGLDVPQITHVACLTNIRSRAWVEQCLCRANRTDEGKTHGHVLCPDEPRMQTIIDEVEREQVGVVFPDYLNPPGPGTGRGPGKELITIVPQGSEATRAKARGLEDGTVTSYDETAVLENAMAVAKIHGITVVQLKQALVAAGAGVMPNSTNPPDYSQDVMTTPSEVEKNLKKSLENSIVRIAKGDKERIIEIQGRIKRRWRARDDMSITELQQAICWLEENYGGVM